MNLWGQVRTLRGLFLVSRTGDDSPCVDSKRLRVYIQNVPVYAGNTRTLGTCYSGRSVDHPVVSKNFRHCVRNVGADKSAPWSAHVAIAFDVTRKPSKIQSWQLVSPSPLTLVPSQSCEERLKRYWVAQSALPANSPQEASVAHLLGPALSDSLGEIRRSGSRERPASKFPPLGPFTLRESTSPHQKGSRLVCRADCWRRSDAWNVANATVANSARRSVVSQAPWR